jgi:cadmium resistance transport/sequestration family protein
MVWFAQALISGITSFVATNLDDIVILMLFFAQVNTNFRPKHIVAGQYLGFTILILASLPGFFGGVIIPKAWIGLLGFVPMGIGVSHLLKQETEANQFQAVSKELSESNSHLPMLSILGNILAPQTYQVAAVTFANGGDNIGIYVPLFANSNLATLGIILIVFFLMVGVWCAFAYYLTRHQKIAYLFTQYGHKLVPFVLIGLGIYIVIESGTYQLLPWF